MSHNIDSRLSRSSNLQKKNIDEPFCSQTSMKSKKIPENLILNDKTDEDDSENIVIFEKDKTIKPKDNENVNKPNNKTKKPKIIPENIVIPEKKSKTKAERRALQEAQRQAKAERVKQGLPAKSRTPLKVESVLKPLELQNQSKTINKNQTSHTNSSSNNSSRKTSGTFIMPKAKSHIATNSEDIDDPQIKLFSEIKSINDDNSYLYTGQMIDMNNIKADFISDIDSKISQTFRNDMPIRKTSSNSYFTGTGNLLDITTSTSYCNTYSLPVQEGIIRSRKTSYRSGEITKKCLMERNSEVQYNIYGKAVIFKTDPNDPRLILNCQTEDEICDEDIKTDSSIVTAANFGEGTSRTPAIMDDPKYIKKFGKKLIKEKVPLRPEKLPKVNHFAHLPQYQVPYVLSKQLPIVWENVQPYFLSLGLKYANRLIMGANARTLSFLSVIKKFIYDYSTPTDKALSRDMEVSLRPALSFLNQCRPLNTGTGNLIKYIKLHISMLTLEMTENDAKQHLYDKIQSFYIDFILKAHKKIMMISLKRVYSNDVILTYGSSSVVKDVIIEALKYNRKLRLIVIDSKPLYEGRKLSYFFSKMGIHVTYSLLNGVNQLMRQATKVLLGANSITHNGHIMTRLGSAIVASVAKEYSVPLIVCAESYKVGERAHTDAIVFNELGDPDHLIDKQNPNKNHFYDWQKHSNVTILNLMYDIIPPTMIFSLITEYGIIPTSSAPTVLRINNGFDDNPRNFN